MSDKRAHCVFGDLEPADCDPLHARIHILPLPYDITSTWRKGADRGPQAIIEASRHMEFYDIQTDSEVYRRGIYTHPAPDLPEAPEAAVAFIRSKARAIVAQ